MTLLCELVAPGPHPPSADTIGAYWALSPHEWARFEQLTIHHGLAGLVSRRLEDLGIGAPRVLQTTARRQWAKNQVLLRTLGEIAVLFRQWGISPWSPLKGVVVLAVGYENLGDRAMHDVDILVPPTQYAKTTAALLRAGCHVVEKDPHHPWSQWASYERSLVTPSGVVIDLHRALGYQARVKWDEMGRWDRMVRYPQLERWAPCALSPEDMWLHLVAHQAQDGLCGPLRQWVDVAFWVTATRPDPAATAQRAKSMGMGTLFEWSVDKLKQLWGIDVELPRRKPILASRVRRLLLDWSFPRSRLLSDGSGNRIETAKRWMAYAGVDSSWQTMQLGARFLTWRTVDKIWKKTGIHKKK